MIPFTGAGAGKVTLTATALVSEVYIPHGHFSGEGNSPEADRIGVGNAGNAKVRGPRRSPRIG